jgi:hypothetical protein
MFSTNHVLFRATMLVIVFLGLVSAFVDAVGTNALGARPGTYGIVSTPTAVRGVVQLIADPDPGTPAARKLCRGDELRLGTTGFNAFQAPESGDQLTVAVDRTHERCKTGAVDRASTLTLRATADHPHAFDVEWAIIRLLTIVVALFIALAARPNDRTARALATFLACIGLLSNWRLYPGAFAILGFVMRDAASVYGFPYFIVFASRFTSSGPDRRAPKLAGVSYERIAALLAALFAAELLAKDILYFRSQDNPVLQAAISATPLVFFAAGLSALLTALNRARGEFRQRLLWVLATMTLSLSGAVAWYVMVNEGLAPPWRDLLALTTILLPFGLSYAILKHHVLDISFAINRAIVFTIVASILVPFFGLLEWIIVETVKATGIVSETRHTDSLLQFLGDRGNRIIAYANACASVLVFCTLRYVHERVDRGVKKLLFRDRDRMLAELEESCHEVLRTSGVSAAAQYVVDVFDEKLGVRGTTVYLAGEGGVFQLAATSAETVPAVIPADDRGILRLKSREHSQNPVVLSAFELAGGERKTALPGAYAVPISGGARLSGVCAIPYGAASKSLAPDELHAVSEVARYTAYALEDFKVRNLEAQLADLRAELHSVSRPLVPDSAAAKTTS